MKLNWNGRASQAPPIADSEWEKHKEVICQLRPMMTLESLMVIMTRDHGFTASRPQYKSRFQKWKLPNLRYLPIPPEIQDAGSGTPQAPSFVQPLLAAPTSDLAKEAIKELTEVIASVSMPIPHPSPSVEHERKDCPQEPEVWHQERETSPIVIRAFNVESLDVDEKPETLEANTPRALLDFLRRHDVAVLSFQDLKDIANTEHLFYATGSYRDAYDMYDTVLQALLAHVPRRLHLLVSAIVNVARSSYDTEQLGNPRQTIEKLLRDFSNELASSPTTEFTLRAHLADVLRKLGQPIKAAEQCDYAVRGIYGWGFDAGEVTIDTRAPAFLLHECGIEVSESFKGMIADHSCLCHPEKNGAACWQIRKPHDEAWRYIFTWCAARLLDKELHEVLPTVIQTMRGYATNNKEFARGLGTVVFCHMWTAYCTEYFREPCEDVAEWVTEIRRLMGISAPEILATASLALTSLAPTWLWHCLQDFNPQWSQRLSLYTPQLLRYMQESALALASVHSDFINALLTAYATINNAQAPSMILGTKYVSAFIKRFSALSLSFSGSRSPVTTPLTNEQNSPFRPLISPLRRPSLDPTLSSTPRSSKSSGYASMVSLQRRIAQKKAEENPTDDPSWLRSGRDSSSSSSLRRQYGLSIASYRTLSTDDSGSWRGSAMDWEPAASTIEVGIAL